MRCSICNARFPFEKSVPNHICLDGKLNGSSCTAPAPAVDDARVERAAREMYRNMCHQEGPWEARSQAVHKLWCATAKDVLAAADAIPAPAVDWQSEPPTKTGHYWWRWEGQNEAQGICKLIECVGYVYHANGYLPLKNIDGVKREWWPVPISEPPARGGTK